MDHENEDRDAKDDDNDWISANFIKNNNINKKY